MFYDYQYILEFYVFYMSIFLGLHTSFLVCKGSWMEIICYLEVYNAFPSISVLRRNSDFSFF